VTTTAGLPARPPEGAPAAPPTGPTTAASGDTTRERLVTAAIDVFREWGYEGARVSEIARRAGLTTGAIYANYRGKADLLLEAIAAGTGAEVDALLGAADTMGSRELLETLGGRLLHDRSSARPLLLEAVVASRRDPDLADLMYRRLDGRAAQVTDVVARGQRNGSIDPDLSTDALVSFCTTLALGALVSRALDLPAPDHHDWDVLIARLLDAVAPRSEDSR
jgi:AcrR family transcriptional regulator